MSNGHGRTAGKSSASSPILGLIPVLVAIAALIFFGVELYYMQGLIASNVPDPQWSRAAYLFGSVEAIAFAASVGKLTGNVRSVPKLVRMRSEG